MRAHRLIGLDKRTGDVRYVSNPGGRPYDTAYAPPTIANVNGLRLLIAGLAMVAVHAIKAQTGEKVWSYIATSAPSTRASRCSGNTVFLSHGDENTEGVELGLMAAIDGARQARSRRRNGPTAEPSSATPLRSWMATGSIKSTMVRCSIAYDTETGKSLWTLPLGSAQKASPVLADGKIFVGNDGGSFFIIKPGADKGEILSRVELPDSTNSCCGSEGTPEQVLGNAAISRGRIFFMSSDAIYAIGSKQRDGAHGIRHRRTCCGRQWKSRVSPGVAHRAVARARSDGEAARAIVRCRRPLPA